MFSFLRNDSVFLLAPRIVAGGLGVVARGRQHGTTAASAMKKNAVGASAVVFKQPKQLNPRVYRNEKSYVNRYDNGKGESPQQLEREVIAKIRDLAAGRRGKELHELNNSIKGSQQFIHCELFHAFARAGSRQTNETHDEA